jgi:hypothetical protein
MFMIHDGILYQTGQDNKLWHCVTTYEAQKIMQKLHERFMGGYFITNITTKNILNASN